jgi:DNA-binding SARP family transcriptional activator
MHIHMFAFGGLVVCSHQSGLLPIASSCLPLLGYLLTHRRRPVLRDEVAGSLWPDNDSEHAKHCLSTVLWRLRKSVGTSEPIIVVRDEALSMNWQAMRWVDAIALERRIEPLMRKAPASLSELEIARIERGVRLYRGDYLIGIDREWALVERQRLRNLYLDGLYSLLLAMAARRDWPRAIVTGCRLVAEEPLREDVHRLLMQAYAAAGNRGKVVEQYKLCQAVLAAELAIEPMEETKELFLDLTGGSTPDRVTVHGAQRPLSARQHIAHAERLLRLCRGHLQRAKELLPADHDLPMRGQSRPTPPSDE